MALFFCPILYSIATGEKQSTGCSELRRTVAAVLRYIYYAIAPGEKQSTSCSELRRTAGSSAEVYHLDYSYWRDADHYSLN
jgi:hypothetical protein